MPYKFKKMTLLAAGVGDQQVPAREQFSSVLAVSTCFIFCPVNLPAVASPGFVVRMGKAGNYVMEHSRWTSGPGAAAAR